jgi:initiation factor 1A
MVHKNREIVLKESDRQLYGVVEKPLGRCRFLINCLDGLQRICYLTGKFRNKKVLGNRITRNYFWIQRGDLVLVRALQDNKGDIIFKYTPSEIEYLRSIKEICFDEGVLFNFEFLLTIS